MSGRSDQETARYGFTSGGKRTAKWEAAARGEEILGTVKLC